MLAINGDRNIEISAASFISGRRTYRRRPIVRRFVTHDSNVGLFKELSETST